MLIPYRSAFDPEIQGEGSIDPLGLAPLADRLTEREIPRDDRAHVAPAISYGYGHRLPFIYRLTNRIFPAMPPRILPVTYS
jgi:hypothetical protein